MQTVLQELWFVNIDITGRKHKHKHIPLYAYLAHQKEKPKKSKNENIFASEMNYTGKKFLQLFQLIKSFYSFYTYSPRFHILCLD